MTSQQLMYQSRETELTQSSKQQPGRLLRTKPATMSVPTAALALTALGFVFVLLYGVTNAVINRNGYQAIRLRRDIEDLRAQVALLEYQNHAAASSVRITEIATAAGMAMTPSGSVDTITVSREDGVTETQLALNTTGAESSRLSDVLSEFMAGGRAEASVNHSRHP